MNIVRYQEVSVQEYFGINTMPVWMLDCTYQVYGGYQRYGSYYGQQCDIRGMGSAVYRLSTQPSEVLMSQRKNILVLMHWCGPY